MLEKIEEIFKKYGFEKKFNKIRLQLILEDKINFWNEEMLTALEAYLKKGKVSFETTEQLELQLEVEIFILEMAEIAKKQDILLK